jgi:protein-S-isoprenylcysteine O-methyltransferase Ste14
MQATNWEFKNRAMLFGLIIGISFGFYALDRQSAIAQIANAVSLRRQTDADSLGRMIFFGAAALLAFAAFLRTWASAWLHASVVYASRIKTDSLVADGPYRLTRNPLYFANILMAISMGSMMSRIGLPLVIAGMIVFCYRLALREECELAETQGASYLFYKDAVPRMWPAVKPRVPSSGKHADWSAGFKAEFWYWGFAAALFAFAITLKLSLFFVVMTASLALFWLSSRMLSRVSENTDPEV